MGVIRRKARRTVRQQARRVAITCGTCGKRYTNPLTHTCTVRTDYKRRVAADKRRQAADAKRRKAAERRERARARRREAAARRRAAAAEARRKAAAKRKAAARPKPASRRPARPQHDYRTCRDEYCDKFPCRVFAEGRREGYAEGHRDGFDKGFTDGYAEGFGDGMAACPLPHQ